MRTHESINGMSQMQEIRHSARTQIRIAHGTSQQFIATALGKTQNKDYEPLHYKDN